MSKMQSLAALTGAVGAGIYVRASEHNPCIPVANRSQVEKTRQRRPALHHVNPSRGIQSWHDGENAERDFERPRNAQWDRRPAPGERRREQAGSAAMSTSRKTTKAPCDLRAPVNAKQKCQLAARRRRLVKQRAAKVAERECVYIDACSGSGCGTWFVTCIPGDGGFLGGF